MENFYGNSTRSYPKKPTDVNSHIQLMNVARGSPFAIRSAGSNNKTLMSPPLNSYTLDNVENIDPQLLMSWSPSSSSSGDIFSTPFTVNKARYLGCFGKSNSSSTTRFPSMFSDTPLTMEEDVLVMDGILVGSARGKRSRLGKDSSASSSSSVKSYKVDVCRSWAETGRCQFGSNCQFAHMKEDSSLTRFSNMGTSEIEICFPGTPFASSSLSSFKVRNSRPTMSSKAAEYGKSPKGSSTVSNDQGSPADGSHSSKIHTSRASKDVSKTAEESPIIHSFDWVPQDDGIDARPPGSSIQPPSSREAVFAYMNKYLYGPCTKNRLPTFTSICADVLGCPKPIIIRSSSSSSSSS